MKGEERVCESERRKRREWKWEGGEVKERITAGKQGGGDGEVCWWLSGLGS